MKKHAIIPIFIPHMGCKESCVFCDQKQITARSKAPSPEDVRTTIDTWMTTLDPDETEIEIAFYGGSFTAIPESMQNMYLEAAKTYLDGGGIRSIHLSTRPDCIDEETLDRLSSYGVRTIELGVQSFDDEVLTLSKRGHDARAAKNACRLIKSYSKNGHEFRLGIQLMVGLPGDTLVSCIHSAWETVSLKPDLARIYPTVVLDGTELMEMYKSGDYSLLSRDDAIARTKAIYEILHSAGIYIMRVGLKSTDIINSENLGAINSGTYHPAFRQLVEGEIARERIEELIEDAIQGLTNMAKPDSSQEPRVDITVYCSPTWISNAVGHEGVNKEYFRAKYPNIKVSFSADDSMSPNNYRIEKTASQ